MPRLVQGKKNCPVCVERENGGTEVYEWRGAMGLVLFDVNHARKMAADGRPSFVLPVDLLNSLLAINHYEETHLEHVDVGKPGILGWRLTGPVLLDGVHRAMRSLIEQRPFYARFLTPRESASCVISEDIWETPVGMVAIRLRLLLEKHPDRDVDVKLNCSIETVEAIRSLLKPEENARIKIRGAE